jgi:hypothetical protein
MRHFLSAFLIVFFSSLSNPQSQSQTKMITWGIASNDPAFNQTMHFAGARQGCSGPPQSCMKYAERMANTYQVKFFLAIDMNDKVLDYAAQYSHLSQNAPYLAEVGFDDFVSQYRKASSNTSGDPSLLTHVIDTLKSANPRLGFGITFYENQLAMPQLSDAAFPPALKQKVDYVHFYLHYRKNVTHYKDYLRQLRQMFPNAQIIAGLYPYDRSTYMPCEQGSSRQCTEDEEVSEFTKVLNSTLDLARSGNLDWVELYPGNFGHEDDWKGWTNESICSSDRRQKCIKISKTMRDTLLKTVTGSLAKGILK